MSRIFFGKISKVHPQQFENNFYAGGKQDSSWYNGLQIGDYVFPIYRASVNKIWKVKGFDPSPNPIDREGCVLFDVVKTFPSSIPISTSFLRYRYFKLDITMLNKSVKHTATEEMGFYEISCEDNCPSAISIDFTDLRNLYIAIENPIIPPIFKEGDIRLLIDDPNTLKINEVQIYLNGTFITYDILNDLYLLKNEIGKRYSLQKLFDFAKIDEAVKKESFLRAAIDGIITKGYYSVSSPIALYDNVLVGRKKSIGKKKKGEGDDNQEEDNESLLSMEDFEDYQEYILLLKEFPNLILYGPPGTGKTYSAGKIIEAFEFDRTKKVISFKQIQETGRISFVTFHQSFSYEEFVEGLRPVITTDDSDLLKGDSDNLKYKVQDGILKQIANKAALSQITSENTDKSTLQIDENSKIWKISLGERYKEEEIYESCLKTNTIAIGWFKNQNIKDWDYEKIYSELTANSKDNNSNPKNNANSINNFVNEMHVGDIVLVFASQSTIRAIGVVDGPYEWKKELVELYPQRRQVKWIKIYDTAVDIVKYNGNKKLSQVTLYELSNIKFLDIKELLESETNEVIKEGNSAIKKALPYFLIIDEINRGNISKIFGELITLIEKDKRNKLKIILPYSQKPFSLPDNLYFIGTMNTADRSIAVLDTALRRRFLFKEIEPSIEIIKTSNYLIDEDLDLSVLAEKMNIKIASMLDRDHRLGHSYFMDVFDLNQFRIRWYYQIIPLLMEYFYNDSESIVKIISDEFIDKKNSNVIWISDNKKFKEALLNIK